MVGNAHLLEIKKQFDQNGDRGFDMRVKLDEKQRDQNRAIKYR